MNFIRALALVCAINLLASCATRAPKRTEWIDEALLHDGRIIHVTRIIKTGLDIALIRLPDGQRSAPKFYSIETINPNMGETISWHGEDSEIFPILIDFDGATAYLVVYVPNFDNAKEIYSCVFPPYVFLRHEQGSKWIRVNPEDVPAFIKSANLSYGLLSYGRLDRMPILAWMREDERERILKIPEKKRAGYQSARNIMDANLVKEREGFFFQVNIPRRISDLKTKRRFVSEKRKYMPDRCKQFDDM